MSRLYILKIHNIKRLFTNPRPFYTYKNYSKNDFPTNLQFSELESNKILNALNQTSTDYLTQLNIPQGQIKKLEVWKRKKGRFDKLSDLLELEGIDIRGLTALCNSILNNKPIEKIVRKVNSKNKQILIPNITFEELKDISSAVGINICPAGVSWARINKDDNRIDEWNFKTFSDLPEKINPIDSFKLAYQIMQNIPTADIYIFESTTGMSMQSKIQASTSFMQQLELSSMIVALLNTSTKHNPILDNDVTDFSKIYFLKSKLPARLFQTLVGNEKVSTISTVTQLIQNESITNQNDLPCLPVNVDLKVKEYFTNQSSIHKEIMGQSLLLIVTFLNICVYQHSPSLKAVSALKKK